MARRVLLARPHLFIIEHMKPFLEGNGFAPEPITELHDLRVDAGVSGIVISTAVNSDVKASWVEVFNLLRTQAPHVPIAMATMVPFGPMARAFQVQLPNGLTYVEPANLPPDVSLGTPETVLVLHRDAIHHGTEHPDADRAVAAHFTRHAA